jgi:hypothetical protein
MPLAEIDAIVTLAVHDIDVAQELNIHALAGGAR